MDLAVKFWRDEISNPLNIPIAWPSQVLENVKPMDCPEGYSHMTYEEYMSYRSSNFHLMEAWYAERQSEE
jgi:hypothetical protein